MWGGINRVCELMSAMRSPVFLAMQLLQQGLWLAPRVTSHNSILSGDLSSARASSELWICLTQAVPYNSGNKIQHCSQLKHTIERASLFHNKAHRCSSQNPRKGAKCVAEPKHLTGIGRSNLWHVGNKASLTCIRLGLFITLILVIVWWSPALVLNKFICHTGCGKQRTHQTCKRPLKSVHALGPCTRFHSTV